MWIGRERGTHSYERVVLHAYDVPHLDLVPSLVHQVTLAEHLRRSVVHLAVTAVALLQKRSMVSFVMIRLAIVDGKGYHFLAKITSQFKNARIFVNPQFNYKS